MNAFAYCKPKCKTNPFASMANILAIICIVGVIAICCVSCFIYNGLRTSDEHNLTTPLLDEEHNGLEYKTDGNEVMQYYIKQESNEWNDV